MNQTFIVIAIVIVAAGYVGRVFYRSLTRKPGCDCGCSGCGLESQCGPPPAGEEPPGPSRTVES